MEPFFIRDPVHDYVTIERPIVRDLLECAEVQRLRRIRQLGFSFVTYPGAEHNRFSHSVGTAELMRQAVAHLTRHGLRLSRLDEDAAFAAALLHDIGHGPFSHCLERAMRDMDSNWEPHEELTKRVLLGGSEIHARLRKRSRELPEMVWRLLKGETAPPQRHRVLHCLLSGNFDLDRLDFIVRDSIFTGVRTGFVDVRRLLNTLELHGDKALVVMGKGRTAVEEFLVARHFMYSAVYFHKTTRGMEAVFMAWVRRIRDVQEALPRAFVDSPLGRLLLEPLSLQAFLRTDDSDVFVGAKILESASDAVLQDLSRRLLRRRPFKVVLEESPEPHRMKEAMEQLDQEAKYPSRYYFHRDVPTDVPYNLMPYWEDPQTHGSDPIYLMMGSEPREITSVSALVRALTHEATIYRIYVPEERREAIARILR